VTTTLTATAPDGVEVRAVDEGRGHPILIVHPGLDDGRTWEKLARLLAAEHRVVILHRRRYRLDLPAEAWSIQDEASDVVALAEALGEPVLLVGHSSGGVVALEALLAAPPAFAGAVLYEPPVHLRPGEWAVPVREAQAASGPGRAMAVFLREIVRVPAWVAVLAGAWVAVSARYRALVPRQIADAAAIDRLGVRLAVYAAITAPTVLLAGTRSPSHLRDRVDTLARTIPGATVVQLDGVGHDAQVRRPATVADPITVLARQLWS
jgi:pimeloyl-ACP methyl ester carboxylesterase